MPLKVLQKNSYSSPKPPGGIVAAESFHVASEEALRCQQAGDKLGMRRALTEMHTLSTTLINILLKMDGTPAHAMDDANAVKRH